MPSSVDEAALTLASALHSCKQSRHHSFGSAALAAAVGASLVAPTPAVVAAIAPALPQIERLLRGEYCSNSADPFDLASQSHRALVEHRPREALALAKAALAQPQAQLAAAVNAGLACLALGEPRRALEVFKLVHEVGLDPKLAHPPPPPLHPQPLTPQHASELSPALTAGPFDETSFVSNLNENVAFFSARAAAACGDAGAACAFASRVVTVRSAQPPSAWVCSASIL
jgi:hypothetical protein